jgi:hypothetical protein
MKRFLLLLAFTLFCSASFVQCYKCRSKKLDDQAFSPQELAIVPYNPLEKYVFKDSLNDSMIYSVTGRWSNMIGPVNELSYSDNHCLGDYCYIENNSVGLVNNDQDGGILLELYFVKVYQKLSFNKAFHLRIEYTTDQYRSFDGFYYFNEQNLIANDPIKAFNSILNIGPKTFNSVYTLFLENSRVETVYYNFNRGIVGFKSNDGHLWYLAN